MKQMELQKFQNSTFDEFAQKKIIEDQKIFMELCLLEDKVQDRSMYLFTISYGGDAMDQRSGVG